MPVKRADNLGNGTQAERDEGRRGGSKQTINAAGMLHLLFLYLFSILFFFSCHTIERQKLHLRKAEG